MAILGMLLVVVGGLIAFAGGIWFLVVAFQESVLWGLGCFFFSFPVSLIFLIMHWDKAMKPFLVQLAGAVPMFLGIAIMAASGDGFDLDDLSHRAQPIPMCVASAGTMTSQLA